MKQILQIVVLLLFFFPPVTIAEEIDLYNLEGEAVVYIDTDEELAIFTWDGEAVSYLVNGCGQRCFYIYTWEGSHIGFYESGIVYDLQGNIVGSVRGALNITYYAPYAIYAQYAQYAKYARYAPYAKPAYSNSASKWTLKTFMTQDSND